MRGGAIMRVLGAFVAMCVLLVPTGSLSAQQAGIPGFLPFGQDQQQIPDTLNNEEEARSPHTPRTSFLHLWGVDILISNDGFGLGTFYRREFTEDLSGFITLSVSGSKDEREIERFDPFTQQSFTPGKLNRFLAVPLTFGAQRRLFREDIVDTFRPYINAGVGPTLIYASPFVNITQNPEGPPTIEEVEFFNSLSKGKAYWTVGGFIGAGAFFGSEKSNVFGVNFRYYFTYLLSDGIPSLFNPATGEVTSTKSSFGGFFITLNIGMGY
jgi:hypothetical protein